MPSLVEDQKVRIENQHVEGYEDQKPRIEDYEEWAQSSGNFKIRVF